MQQSATTSQSMPKTSTASQSWWIMILVIAAIPFAQSIITTPFNGTFTMGQIMVRVLSLTAVGAEIWIIMLAIRSGFAVANVIGGFARWTKFALWIWLAVILAGFAFSSEPMVMPAFIALRYLLQAVALAAMIHIISAALDFDPVRWFGVLAIGLTAYIAYICVFAVLVPDYPDFSWQGMMPSAASIRHIGNYVAILAIAPATLFLFAETRFHRIACAACWIAALTFIAWTGSRAAITGLALGCLVALFFTSKSAPVSRWFQLALGAVAGIGVSVFLPNPDPVYGVVRMVEGSSTAADTSSGRIDIWRHSWEQILQQPWLGHQAGTFGDEMSRLYKYDLDNPHNFLLQYFYDWGFVGGSAVLILLAALAHAVFRRRMQSAALVFPAIAGTTLLFGIGLVEGMLYHPLKMLLVMALIAPLLAQSQPEKSEN